jgi:hypothetical protein
MERRECEELCFSAAPKVIPNREEFVSSHNRAATD